MNSDSTPFPTSDELRREHRQWSRQKIEEHQWARIGNLLPTILEHNDFYRRKLGTAGSRLLHQSSPEARRTAWNQLPFTEKSELIDVDQPSGQGLSGLARNHTWPIERYHRFHRTSGTRGQPMVVLDTPEDWQWWLETWQYILQEAEVTPSDVALMAFSYGPFIGFWTAHEAILARGALAIPTGGMTSLARLELIFSTRATVLCCTPSYALHLIQLAEQRQMPLNTCRVQKIIVAGEPGGCIPEIRQRIENAWQARVIDHAGATEIGPWGVGTEDGRGLYVLETEFLAEFLPIQEPSKADDSQLRELVLTSLGRVGCPVIRYRTGDLVQPSVGSSGFVRLEGGIRGRLDDMIVVRGVNVFQAASKPSCEPFQKSPSFASRPIGMAHWIKSPSKLKIGCTIRFASLKEFTRNWACASRLRKYRKVRFLDSKAKPNVYRLKK